MPSVAMPAYLQPITDPAFKTQVTRIADQSAMSISNQYIRHGYAKRTPFNADDSLIVLIYSGLYGNAPVIDAHTYKMLRKISVPDEPRLSSVDPNKLFGISGNSFISENLTTGAKTTLHSFSDYSGLSIGSGEGNISSDDRYVVLSGTKGGKDAAVVYDIQNNAIVADKVLGDGAWNYDWISISQSGNFIVIEGDDSGGSDEKGVFVYDRNLNLLRKVDTNAEHGDFGYTPSGKEVFVQWDNSTGGISAYPLDGGSKIEVKRDNWIGGHISCRNNKRPGWCYLSEDHGNSSDAGANEVYAIKLDTSGTVERFAHMHISANPSYEGQPMAVPSRDGSKALWASDWQKGNSAPIYAYVAEVAGNTGSTPAPTSIVPTTTIPSPTSAGGSASLSIQVFLHGIGKGGDNANTQSSGNTSPKHPQRSVSIEMYNAANQLAATKTGTITYNSTAGNFQGNVSLGTLSSGAYTAKIKIPQYLKKGLPGIITLPNTASGTVGPISLTTGDANNDNALSILDYNMILDCFSDLTPAKNCSDANKKTATDLTDDGNVNQFDYNLFLRELSVQSGE
jgi:hypothetical protein